MIKEEVMESKKQKRGRQGYVHRSNALNITVYDLHGRPISDKVICDILETVNEKSLEVDLMFSHTRT